MANLTFEQKLIEELPLSGFLSGGKPVGREGFEVIVVERIGTGNRFYCTLAPGDTLRISERLFGSYYAYIVDMRPARLLTVSEQFPTVNPLIKVKVTAKVLYRALNARRLATEVEDPLGKFRDRILGTLRREIGQMPHQKVTEAGCERIITGVGTVQSFALAVEGIDYIIVEQDEQVLRGVQQRASLEYQRGLGQEVDDENHRQALRKQEQAAELKRRELQAKLELDGMQQDHTLDQQRRQIEALNLRDLNTLLHLRPELTQEIFLRLSDREQQDFRVRLEHDTAFRNRMLDVLDNYIRNNDDANPDDMLRLIREASEQSANMNPRITFGQSPPSSSPGRISFGRIVDSPALPPPTPTPPADSPDD